MLIILIDPLQLASRVQPFNLLDETRIVIFKEADLSTLGIQIINLGPTGIPFDLPESRHLNLIKIKRLASLLTILLDWRIDFCRQKTVIIDHHCWHLDSSNLLRTDQVNAVALPVVK